MRIAQVAPLTESVPPTTYGGTERVVSVLTEQLVARGHEVTLFASGDSQTAARLMACSAQGLRLSNGDQDPLALAVMQLDRVLECQHDFDVIHNHLDFLAFPLARVCSTPLLSTCHGRLDLAQTVELYNYFKYIPLVSISDDQRRPLPQANWVRTVYNGIDFDAFELHPVAGEYLAFLGRIAPEKRVDRAIEVARELDIPLKIAAKIDPTDQEYFEHAVRPFLDSHNIEFVGEVNEAQKNQFLGEAMAYLFPIDWPEPFGLTMIESMACGTPVVALDSGSVPEVVDNGVTGFACSSLREFIECVSAVADLDRTECRKHAELRFSGEVMADGYEEAFQIVTDRLRTTDVPIALATAEAPIGLSEIKSEGTTLKARNA